MVKCEERDRYEGARESAQNSFESIREMVEALEGWTEETAKAGGWEPYTDKFGVACWRTEDGDTFAGTARQLCEAHGLEPSQDEIEAAQERIQEDALSVEVRSGWYVAGRGGEDIKPTEYCILLCTGGPAVRITGELSEHGEPETARLEMQDWFLPWSEYRPTGQNIVESEKILLAYARQFYFGG